MCGIFAYLNYLAPRTRREVIDILIKGLQRLEYRGYDSAGIAIDGGTSKNISVSSDGIILLKRSGKVKALEDEIISNKELDPEVTYDIHCGIAHTRWATHGEPNWVNSHPQRSDPDNEFVVCHNGIVTNYKDIKQYLENKGYEFESETDTEIIAKLIGHIHKRHPQLEFRQLVEQVVQQLEGAFALVFKSRQFPGELVATRRGSPLLVGIKSKTCLTTDHFPVYYSKARRLCSNSEEDQALASVFLSPKPSKIPPTIPENDDDSTTEFRPSSSEVEYFFASDASAVIEHTKQVIFLEDDDVAAVKGGTLTIHRLKRKETSGSAANAPQTREVHQLNMEIQQIMKGDFKTFMQKEIFNNPTAW